MSLVNTALYDNGIFCTECEGILEDHEADSFMDSDYRLIVTKCSDCGADFSIPDENII